MTKKVLISGIKYLANLKTEWRQSLVMKLCSRDKILLAVVKTYAKEYIQFF